MSDWQAAGLLVGQDLSTINPYLIYKGCIAHANNGQTHAAERMLNAAYQQLLLARRYLKTDLESKMIEALNFEIDLKHPRYFELMGDREHILGSHFNRQSEPANAAQHFARAHTYFQQGADAHRALRSLINQAICFSTAASHTAGELFFLKQRANREGFHDLAGNIEKAAVSVWLAAGNHAEALRSSQASLNSYNLDGCPEDRAVVLALLAICQVLVGKIEDAQISAKSVLIRNGKVERYLTIIDDLLQGRVPQIPAQHHLASVSWCRSVHRPLAADASVPLFATSLTRAQSGVYAQSKRGASPKANSIPGQILKHLAEQNLKRDELIRKVWGENAIDASYCARLYSAINDLRHKFHVDVQFDGEAYLLGEKSS